ncbi:hypothetical protein, partial [Caldibacillus thermoamylovorans]|uniref:hypothetical protein n=1 Tax=Caldibacillus thermoamylovorans TaxID=35841 RepID=UPI00054DADAC
MINRILAEFLKIKRQPELRIVLSVFLLFILFIFFQKGMNRQSGFYSPELLNAQYLSSFNLLLICLVGFIPVVVIGSFISGIEYKNNTNVFTITSTGRIYSVLVKIITLIFTILLLVLSMVLLGIIESLLIIPKKNIYIEWSILIPQLLTTFLDLLGSAFLGFLCTVLTKKIYGGIIFAVILPLIIERISFYVPYFQYFTFDYYSLS